MVQTRASAPAGRVYTSSRPPRQRLLRDTMDNPRRVRKRPSAGPLPPLRQETVTQMEFLYGVDDYNDENEAPEEEAVREHGRKRKRRRTLGDSSANRSMLARKKQSTLTQIPGFFWRSDEELPDSEEEAESEEEERVKREDSFPIWEDEPAGTETELRGRQPRHTRASSNHSDDELPVLDDDDEPPLLDDDEPPLLDDDEEPSVLDNGNEPPVLTNDNEPPVFDDDDERPGVDDTREIYDENEDEEEENEENDTQLEEAPNLENSPELGDTAEYETNLSSEGEGDDDDHDEEQIEAVRRERPKVAGDRKEICDSDEESDFDEEIDQNDSYQNNQLDLDSNPSRFDSAQPAQAEVQVQVGNSMGPPPITPRKRREEIPDSDAESEDITPAKITPPRFVSSYSLPTQITPSRRTPVLPKAGELNTLQSPKAGPVSFSQATTVDHTQFMSSQGISATQKTPSRRTVSREQTKTSPFVLRSSQLLTESQMLPAGLMDSMPMPPVWTESYDEDDEDDEL